MKCYRFFFLIMKIWTWGTDVRCNQANVNLCHQAMHSHSDLIKKHLRYGMDAGLQTSVVFSFRYKKPAGILHLSHNWKPLLSGCMTTWSHYKRCSEMWHIMHVWTQSFKIIFITMHRIHNVFLIVYFTIMAYAQLQFV